MPRFYMRVNLRFIYDVKHFALHLMHENATVLYLYRAINKVLI